MGQRLNFVYPILYTFWNILSFAFFTSNNCTKMPPTFYCNLYTSTFKDFDRTIKIPFFHSEPVLTCFCIITNFGRWLTILSYHDRNSCNLPATVKSSAKTRRFGLSFISFDVSFRWSKGNIPVAYIPIATESPWIRTFIRLYFFTGIAKPCTHLHAAHFSLHQALCNTLSVIRTKISHVIGQYLQI